MLFQPMYKHLTQHIPFIKVGHHVSPCAVDIWSSIVFGGPRQITMISSSEDRSVRDHVTQDRIAQYRDVQDHVINDRSA